jgi:hypothetical protein
MEKTQQQDKIISKTKEIVTNWKNGSLKIGNRGYKFRYYDFINIGYLYLHGVDAQFPDLLDPKNDSSFVADFLDSYTKINEQTRIDFKELGFIVDNVSELGEFIVKSANRKNLTIEND